ncbi:hypothetical protein SV7mr_46990 [Stieleria bergensis]|uniref:Uncharacterized protein n=1 Tax=Stieleria bergensis TaxID=2528025 RepID=A0A517T1B7_9BACT|nr:hypothetical protein SV7mr_46990 [Planctomycetes bacterium SV_7m_r]
MTWETPYGDRSLTGEEAILVRQSIAVMVEELANCRETEEDPWEYGVEMFDVLSWQQQLALINDLARALLQDTLDVVARTGVADAGVAAIYHNVYQQIELEIELEPFTPIPMRHRWRQFVLNAYRDNEYDEVIERETRIPAYDAETGEVVSDFDVDVNCTDPDSWNWLIDSLADRVLCDRDYEMVNVLIDAPPEDAKVMREALGIDADYYIAIAPDPSDQQIDVLFDSLMEMTRQKPR